MSVKVMRALIQTALETHSTSEFQTVVQEADERLNQSENTTFRYELQNHRAVLLQNRLKKP